MKKTLFISDLHLDESHPETAKIFLQFLQGLDENVDALYILGDLFEAWIGDDDLSDFNRTIFNAIHSVSARKIPVYFLHGNRDFLIGKKFAKLTGCTIIPDETIVNVYGESVLLMHGDVLCTKDIAYLKARKWMRNTLLQKAFQMLPLNTRKKIASKLRQKSQQHVKSATMDIMDVTHSEVARIMKKHQITTLIHGHTHRMAMHQFNLDNTPALRIVLDAWHGHGNVLFWDENNEKKLITL